jgi:hypothetical protein
MITQALVTRGGNKSSRSSDRCGGIGLDANASGPQLDRVRSCTGVARPMPDSGGFGLVSGLAFFVEVGANPARLYLPPIGKLAC